MQKVIIDLSVISPIYDISPGKSASEIAANFGVTDPALYLEFSDSDFDPACYKYPAAFNLSGGVISFSLPLAKLQATEYEKANYSILESQAQNNYTVTQLSSQASLPTANRLPAIQSILDAVNVLAVELSDKLTAISLSADINELNNIVNPPTGTLFTGRGAGLGPLDLNESYYTVFNSVSMTEADTELYVPGTSTVIPYGSYPGGFDSLGNCFTLGNYLLQIRETATGSVIAEFECPLAPAGVDVVFPA
jgi:outer membrane protein assembly factor BamA